MIVELNCSKEEMEFHEVPIDFDLQNHVWSSFPNCKTVVDCENISRIDVIEKEHLIVSFYEIK
jgi:hypothetical protein